MAIRTERARVLITVKATPQPSGKYGDTVCVAGIRFDGDECKWIRLYPIDFRWLEQDQQFHKYDVIELDVARATGDSRKESYRPIQGTWQRLESLPAAGTWARRHEIIRKVATTSTCTLMSDAAMDHAAPSLGLVPVRDIDALEFEKHDPWTPEQLAKMQDRMTREASALLPAARIPTELIAPRFKVFYRYRCEDPSCGGHRGRNLDWELTALQNRYRDVSDERLKTIITERFHTLMFQPEKKWSALMMGNFEDARKRSRFSVLGVYYPPIATASSVELF